MSIKFHSSRTLTKNLSKWYNSRSPNTYWQSLYRKLYVAPLIYWSTRLQRKVLLDGFAGYLKDKKCERNRVLEINAWRADKLLRIGVGAWMSVIIVF